MGVRMIVRINSIWKLLTRGWAVLTIMSLLPFTALADNILYKWEDSSGGFFLTENLDKIPEEYRKGAVILMRDTYDHKPKCIRAFIKTRKAATTGDSAAQLKLGLMYSSGYGITKDENEGLKWITLAATKGLPVAQRLVGEDYLQKENFTEASKWYELSANQGDSLSQERLGYLFVMGTGVPQDFVKAYMWLNLSAEDGNSQAVSERLSLMATMTEKQIAESRGLARNWNPS